MCIVLLTTAHPSYALILINNRDEFILRPTSRPHWWTPSSPSSPLNPTPVLSSRDLHRPEQGTWLGISRGGNLAVLTNYREPHAPPATARSRGSIPAAWLGAHPDEPTAEFVERLLREDSEGKIQDVGGFSLICGKLRPAKGTKGGSDGKAKRVLSPLAVLSNRATHASHVPWITHDEECTDGRLHVHGLSNAVYIPTSTIVSSTETAPEEWPKVRLGKAGLLSTVSTAASEKWDEARLLEGLFDVLSTNTLELHPGDSFDKMIMRLKTSVFIPAVGDAKATEEMEKTRQGAPQANGSKAVNGDAPAEKVVEGMDTENHKHRPDHGFETGLYGTQRQTVLLIDWDGNVTYVERALYDEWGREVAKGEGDEVFRFKIEGWEEGESDGKVMTNGVEA